MRLFLAVEIEDDVREGIARVVASLAADVRRVDRPAARRFRWVSPAHVHLTLHFLGEVDDGATARLVRAFSSPLDCAPFTLTLEGLGAFPPGGPARVVWMGATVGTPALVRLHALVAARLEGLGLATERRPYAPHLTLARLREPATIDLDGLRRAAGPAASFTTGVRGVTLFRSHLSPAGPRYEALARAGLVP